MTDSEYTRQPSTDRERGRWDPAPACGRCLFFQPAPRSKTTGACHRDPPRWTEHDSPAGEWPTVAVTGWCGEFRYDPDREPGGVRPTLSPTEKL